mmetsp:Transcript_18667/g.47708  ORF Transcript_18667/g.47708 Transcript_18667/m.47708 type:complete len:226 (-) Transcript_18667:411-1088(-)
MPDLSAGRGRAGAGIGGQPLPADCLPVGQGARAGRRVRLLARLLAHERRRDVFVVPRSQPRVDPQGVRRNARLPPQPHALICGALQGHHWRHRRSRHPDERRCQGIQLDAASHPWHQRGRSAALARRGARHDGRRFCGLRRSPRRCRRPRLGGGRRLARETCQGKRRAAARRAARASRGPRIGGIAPPTWSCARRGAASWRGANLTALAANALRTQPSLLRVSGS